MFELVTKHDWRHTFRHIAPWIVATHACWCVKSLGISVIGNNRKFSMLKITLLVNFMVNITWQRYASFAIKLKPPQLFAQAIWVCTLILHDYLRSLSVVRRIVLKCLKFSTAGKFAVIEERLSKVFDSISAPTFSHAAPEPLLAFKKFKLWM